MGVAHEQDHDLVHWPGPDRRGRGVRAVIGGGAGGWLVGPGDRGARPGGPEHGRGTRGVSSVSCASAGDCAAGGYYIDRSVHRQGFVVAERHGGWGTAIEAPGLGALNTGGDAQVASVSCASAGNCAAGGSYTGPPPARPGVRDYREERPLGRGDRGARPGGTEHGRARPGHLGVVRLGGQLRGRRVLPGPPRHDQGFVAVERHGRWGAAIEVPGLGALNTGRSQYIAGRRCRRCRAPRRATARPAGTT